MRKLLAIILLALCLGACGPGRNDYSDFKHIPSYGWRYSDVLTFTPEHGDSIAQGVLTLALRHTNDYLYSNLYVEVAYTDASGKRYVDTLAIDLADKYGHWKGRGVGTDFQIVDTINPRLVHARGHNVKVRHVMRLDTLEGIDLVGLQFKEIKN